MKSNPQWLYLEPYVHLNHQQQTVLFYNSVSRKTFEFTADEEVMKIIALLEDPANGYVVPLSSKQLTHEKVISLLANLRKKYMGDLMDASWSKRKPVNIIPKPFVRHPLQLKQPGKGDLGPALDPRNYIQEVTFVMRTGLSSISEPYQDAPAQFFYPEIATEKREDMPYTLFLSIFRELNTYTPTLIHVSGARFTDHPAFKQIVTDLTNSPFEKKYHLHLAHWDPDALLSLLSLPHTSIAFYLTFPLETHDIATWLKGFGDKKIQKKIEFNIIVRTPEELNQALEIEQISGIERLFFKPYFTGDNLDFFREYVFISKEDILGGKPTQKNILSRVTINENDMGKFMIFPSGATFANLNDPLLGNAHNRPLLSFIEEEITRGRSWKRTRQEVLPCRDCLYKFLCPPISSYEIFMNRYNFCDVFPTPENP